MPPPIATVRHAGLSLWQSAVAATIRSASTEDLASHQVLDHPMLRAATAHAQAAAAGAPVAPPAAGPAAGPQHPGLLAYLSGLHYGLAEATRTNQAAPALEQEHRKYSEYDMLGWLGCQKTYLEYWEFGLRSPVYRDWKSQGGGDPTYSLIPYRLPDDARVALLADWSTGMDDSAALLAQIRADHDPTAVIHLGDVYYSGLQPECAANFLQVFQKVFGDSPAPVFNLPGNHDYYSGGGGFYWLLDNINSRPEWRQQASYFCLRTADDRWQFLGMDTGRHDWNPFTPEDPLAGCPYLEPTEIGWHQDKLDNFAGSTILLSHHQLLSARSAIDSLTSPARYRNPHLMQVFSPYFPKIAAWFWGHEHSLGLFEDGLFGLRKARLIGCSGYEAAQGEDPYEQKYPEAPYRQPVVKLGMVDGYYNHGYAIADLKRASPSDPITVSYYQIPSWSGDTEKPLPPDQPRLLATEQLFSIS